MLLGVGIAVYNSILSNSAVHVSGLIGSEKQPFFDDIRVQERLKELGYVVEYQKAGSRQIATSFDLSSYDYAFPAGLPAAEKIKREVPGSKSFNPFFTPMAVASWKPLVDVLEANNLSKQEKGYYSLDMQAYLNTFQQKTRWKELENNPDFSINKRLMINSTDVRKSNSAAMYLALASYVLNANNIVKSEGEINNLFPAIAEIFTQQGFIEGSSAQPFNDYLLMGMGKAPLVMIYESQYIYQAANDGIDDDMVLLYPKPSLFTKHVFIGFNEDGKQLGLPLETDPELQKLAIEHGFRNSNMKYFDEFINQHNISLPKRLVNVIEPPAYEYIESIITKIEQQY